MNIKCTHYDNIYYQVLFTLIMFVLTHVGLVAELLKLMPGVFHYSNAMQSLVSIAHDVDLAETTLENVNNTMIERSSTRIGLRPAAVLRGYSTDKPSGGKSPGDEDDLNEFGNGDDEEHIECSDPDIEEDENRDPDEYGSNEEDMPSSDSSYAPTPQNVECVEHIDTGV